MKEIEEVMRETVKSQLTNAVKNYPEKNRNDWIRASPAQSVITSSQIWWTNETEKAIENRKLPEHSERYFNQLKELVKMTRERLTQD